MRGRRLTAGARVTLAYDADALGGDVSARDVADQLDAVEQALKAAGLAVSRLGVDLDLAAAKRELAGTNAGVVFNLVESLGGSDRLQTLFPMALEDWGVPFTGSGSLSMLLSNDKLLAKRVMSANGLPSAEACGLDRAGRPAFHPAEAAPPEIRPGRWIVKPLESHASRYIDDAAVRFCDSTPELADRIRRAEDGHGARFFAERFIDGREFNISMVETEDGVAVLPPAEIAFAGLPAGKPRIVGYAAKWDETSAEYAATPRAFDTLSGDPRLGGELRRLSLGAWDAFGLSGYARVDFRVDGKNRPFMLEVNANPCLSPGAGLAAATERHGWTRRELYLHIAASAKPRQSR